MQYKLKLKAYVVIEADTEDEMRAIFDTYVESEKAPFEYWETHSLEEDDGILFSEECDEYES